MLPKQKLHKQVIIIQGCRLEVSFAVIQYCNNDKAFYNSEMASELTKDGYHFFLFFRFVFSYSVSLKSDILLYTVDKIMQLNPPLPSKTSIIWPDEMTASLWCSGASFGKIETCDSRLSLKPGKSNRDESSFHYLNSLSRKKKKKHFLKNEMKLYPLSHDLGLTPAHISWECLPGVSQSAVWAHGTSLDPWVWSTDLLLNSFCVAS